MIVVFSLEEAAFSLWEGSNFGLLKDKQTKWLNKNTYRLAI